MVKKNHIKVVVRSVSIGVGLLGIFKVKGSLNETTTNNCDRSQFEYGLSVL